MTAAMILDRLDRVRQTGDQRWIACCPAHDDRSPSLAIKECSDSRVLLHCFAGCEVEDVLIAVGLTFSDLMPGKFVSHRSRPERWLNSREALATLDHESHVVAVIGADLHEHKVVDGETWNRLAKAVGRIGDTRAKFAAARIGR